MLVRRRCWNSAELLLFLLQQPAALSQLCAFCSPDKRKESPDLCYGDFSRTILIPVRSGSGAASALPEPWALAGCRMGRTGLLFALLLLCDICWGQDLTPRAYVVTPIHTNAVILTYSYFKGGVLFDPTIPVTDVQSEANLSALSIFHTFSFFGRSASFTATLPYSVARLRGMVTGAPTAGEIHRSGLLDGAFRLSVNLRGGPAMDVKEYARWRQKTLLGASLTLVTPTGQYDPARLINQGSNRWAFKPEIGLSRRFGHWLFDAYGAVWFFTANPEFFSHNVISPGTNTRAEAPIAACESHVSYDLKPRFWTSLDINFWTGGRTSINGVTNVGTLQRSSRIGGTISVPVSSHQALKFSYSNGAYIRYGGNYQNLSVAWQYSWQGRQN